MANPAESRASMIVQWLKDLWKETCARYAVLIGFAGNVITFLFPGLRSNALRTIAVGLLVVGFIWANFRVYVKLRSEIADAQAAVANRTIEKRDFTLSLAVVGVPPSPQSIKVTASQTVSASRLDYLLSDGTCIASDNLSLEGETFEIPIEDRQVVKLWNTPRADRNPSDHSGPAHAQIA